MIVLRRYEDEVEGTGVRVGDLALDPNPAPTHSLVAQPEGPAERPRRVQLSAIQGAVPDGSITTPKLQDEAVTGAKIRNETISGNAKLERGFGYADSARRPS